MKGESGSAVVTSVVGILLSSLIFISTLGLVFSGYNLLIIREIAVSAAREGALADRNSLDAERYALRLLRDSIPRLANYEINALNDQRRVIVEIRSNLVGFGLLESWVQVRAKAMASKENAI